MDRTEYVNHRKNLLANKPAPSLRGTCSYDKLITSVDAIGDYYLTDNPDGIIHIYENGTDKLVGSYNKNTELFNISDSLIVDEINK